MLAIKDDDDADTIRRKRYERVTRETANRSYVKIARQECVKHAGKRKSIVMHVSVERSSKHVYTCKTKITNFSPNGMPIQRYLKDDALAFRLACTRAMRDFSSNDASLGSTELLATCAKGSGVAMLTSCHTRERARIPRVRKY